MLKKYFLLLSILKPAVLLNFLVETVIIFIFRIFFDEYKVRFYLK